MDNLRYPDPTREETDWDDYAYTDPEHTDEEELPKEKQGKREKSPERKRREAEFLSLYNAYMHPAKQLSAFRIQCQQDDLYTLLCQLTSGWAYRKAASYVFAGFSQANGEDALSIGCYYAHSKLLEDKAAGRCQEHPVAYYQRLAQNKAIDDYFRKEFGRYSAPKKKPEEGLETFSRRKDPGFLSIDAMGQDSDGYYHGDRNVELSYDPFASFRRPRQERRELAGQLSGMFLSELMNYGHEPQKPLAVMYGNILFQVAKYHGSDPLSQTAKASTKVYSPAWAHARMEQRNLKELGTYSEQVLFRLTRKEILWGPAFRMYLKQSSPVGGLLWGEVVYTKTYSEKQTSDWIESISKTIVQKCARQTARDREKVEFVEETFNCRNKLRKALNKIEKEAGR